MSVTIKDIAKQAGVSHATVSRALRDHPAIRPETTERIKKIAAELGYIPSAVARGLKTSRSKALGVIVSSIDDPFFSEVLEGIENVLQEAGYSLFLSSSHRDYDYERAIVRAMGERRVDGVIICSSPFSDAHSRQLQDYRMPIAIINNQAAEEFRYAIYHDDRFGSQQITRHLIALGHERIAYLGNTEAGRTTKERLQGYLEAMTSAGFHPCPEYIFNGPNGKPEGGLVASRYFLTLPERPTALVCFNDMMAIGAANGIREAGLRIPEDISVTGFDNIGITPYLNPPLTTFHQPKYDLGFEAAELMLRLLSQNPANIQSAKPEILVLRGELIVRASTSHPMNYKTFSAIT